MDGYDKRRAEALARQEKIEYSDGTATAILRTTGETVVLREGARIPKDGTVGERDIYARRASPNNNRPLLRIRCNAKSKQTGEQCKQWACSENGKCKWHGGRLTRNSRTITSARTKALPKDMRKQIEAIKSDPKLMDMTEDVALAELMIRDRLSQLRSTSQERREAWGKAKELYDAAIRSAGSPSGMKALEDLGDVLTQGVTDNGIIEDVFALIDRKGRIIDRHGRHQVQQKMMVSLTQIESFVIAFTNLLNEELESFPDVLKRLSEKIARLYQIEAQTNQSALPGEAVDAEYTVDE